MAREFINTSLYSDANLTHYYRLEGNGNATVGPNGTATNVTFGTSYGKFGQGGLFTRASSSKIAFTDSTNFSSAYTVAAWINPASLPASGNFHFAIGMEKNGFGLNLYNSSGTQQVRSYHTNSAVNADKGAVYNYTLTTGTWYHLAATWTGSLVTLYLNGKSVATNSWSDIQTNGSTNCNIGAWIGASPSHFFDGSIDDLNIFSRALTASEVKSIYTSRTFQKDTNNSLNVGLVSYYKLGDTKDFYGGYDGTATNVTFSSGKVNNGAVFSAASTSKILTTTPCNITSTSPFSIAGWFNMANTTSGYLICSNFAGAGALFFDIVKDGYVPNKVTFEIGKSGTGVTHIEAATYSTNTWEFYAVTYDGANNMKLYRNNDTVVTGTYSIGSATSSGANLGIGYATNNTNYITGSIDEVGFWSKALSTTEISDLYNSGNGQTMNPPIEFDNATTPNYVTATSLTYSHTCGAGANRILWVGVWGDTTSDAITGVTYGGTAMTLIDKVSGNTIGDRWTYLYYLINPATGANNVVVSASSSMVIGSDAYSYYGAKQSGVPDASTKVTQASNVTSQVTTLTTIADNCWTVLYAKGNVVVASTNTVKRTGDSGGRTVAGDSGNPITPAGSFSMTVTQSSAPMATVMASFAPYVASTTNIKSINSLAYAQIKSVNGVLTSAMKNFNGLT